MCGVRNLFLMPNNRNSCTTRKFQIPLIIICLSFIGQFFISSLSFFISFISTFSSLSSKLTSSNASRSSLLSEIVIFLPVFLDVFTVRLFLVAWRVSTILFAMSNFILHLQVDWLIYPIDIWIYFCQPKSAPVINPRHVQYFWLQNHCKFGSTIEIKLRQLWKWEVRHLL